MQAIRARATSAFTKNPVGFENFDISTEKGYNGTFEGGSPESLPSPDRPPLRHIDKYIRPECPCFTKRYTMAVLTCFGFIISFGMRCNMGMAKLRFENKTEHGTYSWTVATESAIDSSFFWGYLITQIPGGFLASLYPANRIFGTAIGISCFLNLLVPGAINLGPAMVILVRVMQGVVEGVTYPACHGIWRFWAPPLERSRLATLAFCGSYAGIVFGMPLSALFTSLFDWQAPFYFYGVCGLIWFLVWQWLSFERPSKHPTISARELVYIEQSLGDSVTVAMPTFETTPWREFSRSMPVYAIIVANFCRSWNFYLLVIFQSSYLTSSFNFDITKSGFVGALPHLLMTVIVPFGGMLADYLRKNNILSTTSVRKLFNCGGFGMEGLFFIVLAYARDSVTATTALTFGVAFSGFAISGYNVNHLDIAPRYASILMGLSNGIGTIAGIISPVVVDHILNNDKSPAKWKIVFLMAASVHLVGITFYGLFASGELQPWAEPSLAQQQSWEGMPRKKSSTYDGYQETTLTERASAPVLGDAPPPAYGSIQPTQHAQHVQHVPNNPFVSGALLTQGEPVQPPADPQEYLRDSLERTY